jgi:aspartyl-tRNA(Asn)/glutamyl-tRNA(Gln) amidotransferase subunit A
LPEGEAEFPWPQEYARSRPLRIGVVKKPFGDSKIPSDVQAAFEAAIKVMQDAGANIGEVDMPEGPYETAAGVVISAEGAAAFRYMIESGEIDGIVDPLGRVGAYVSTVIPADDFVRAMQIRTITQKKAATLFDKFDVITSPSQPVAATTLSTNLETDLSFSDPVGGIGNFCGLPAISVPCGFTRENLPVGIQFVGNVLDELAVVTAAKMYQSKTNWNRERPPLQ